MATLAMEAAGYGSKVPPKLEQLMVAKRAEIARLRRQAHPEGKAEYQDFDARMEVIEHQVREMQSVISLILARMNPTTRNRLIGFTAMAFIILGLGQWSIFEIRVYYLASMTTVIVGGLMTALALVIATLLFIVRKYVET
jgi:hypothetical protein